MTSPLDLEFRDEDVDDLRRRIETTRWPDEVSDDWDRGTKPSVLRAVLKSWADFDLAAVARRLSAEEHVRVSTRAGGHVHLWLSGAPDALPLVLLHGWPDSYVRYRPLVDVLAGRYRLIVPSVPGFGFSTAAPRDAGGPAGVARQLLEALDVVGVRTFGVYGGDISTAIGEQLALLAPDRVVGLNLSDVPMWRAVGDPDLTEEERRWVDDAKGWAVAEGAYAQLQRTKPQTLAAGLTDSPAGLASWILEKFQSWGDGDVFDRVPIALFLEKLSVYWFTRTAGRAARYYYDTRAHPPSGGRVTVPTGFGLFPADIDHGPQAFAQRWYPLERFTRFERGGHFGALEQPHALADDLDAFFGRHR